MLTDSPLFKVIVVANIRVYYDDAGKPLTGGGTLGTQNSASVIVNGKKRIIDETGKEVIPLKYKECYSFNKNRLATLYIKNKYCYIEKKGTQY